MKHNRYPVTIITETRNAHNTCNYYANNTRIDPARYENLKKTARTINILHQRLTRVPVLGVVQVTETRLTHY